MNKNDVFISMGVVISFSPPDFDRTTTIAQKLAPFAGRRSSLARFTSWAQSVKDEERERATDDSGEAQEQQQQQQQQQDMLDARVQEVLLMLAKFQEGTVCVFMLQPDCTVFNI